jgi:TPR repeat protein
LIFQCFSALMGKRNPVSDARGELFFCLQKVMMRSIKVLVFFLLAGALLGSFEAQAAKKKLTTTGAAAPAAASSPAFSAPFAAAPVAAPPIAQQSAKIKTVVVRKPKPKKSKPALKPEMTEKKPAQEPVIEAKPQQSPKADEKTIFAPRSEAVQSDKTGRFWECLLQARQNQVKELRNSIEQPDALDKQIVDQTKLALAEIFADANFSQADKINPKLFNLEKSCGKDFHEEDFQVFFRDEGTKNQFRNYKAAIRLYSEVESAGLSEGGLGMAKMYARGAGHPKDLMLALTKGLGSAKKGLSEAQSFVGQIYQGDDFSESGSRSKGLTPNNKLAYMWLNIAAAEGNEKAKQIRDRLSEKMSFEEVAAAQALSSKCAASGFTNCEN